MAIMAMATAKNINKCRLNTSLAIILLVVSPLLLAKNWKFTPSVALDETYSNNVELTINDPTSSFVTQAIVGVTVDYQSHIANWTLSGTKNYATYSHDSELKNDYRTLSANGQYYFWTSGPSVIASSSITNQSRNNANNSLASIVSSDTIEARYHSAGLEYNFGNSSYSIQSSVIYSTNEYEDSIGDSDGFAAQLTSMNGNNARHIYWQFSAHYSKRKQDNINEGENYTLDTLVGAITSWSLNPFVRFYDEDIKGTGVSQNINTTSSWGPGIRWLASPHIIIDLSYNFIADKTVSDNYIATTIQWEPSSRTSLTASYSQRFFGDSYNLDFQHKTKRLTNSLTYDENLEVFSRNNYQQISTGDIELIESNEYSLNRRFAWTSKLQLSRTSFSVNMSANEQKGLENNVKDDILSAGLVINRNTGAKSNISLSAKYDYLIFDKDNPEGSNQEDHYRTVSATFTKHLASALSSKLTVEHVNRDSTVDRFSYDEVRVIINITKEF
jgi:hypothetical protein